MHNNIRRPLYDGMRDVHALWFDVELLGEAQARTRVLRHWQAGAQLHRAADGYLLTLARPRMADCATLDGLALCRIDGVLSSAPLAPDERRSMPYGGCWLVRGALAHAISLNEADKVDPALWIDVSAIAVRTPLAPPAGKAYAALDAPEQEKSLRDILDNVIPAPSGARDDFLRALAQSRQGASGLGSAASAAAGIAGAAMAVAGAAAMLPMLLRRMFSQRAGSATTAEGPARPAPDSDFKQRLHAAAARLAMLTRMSSLIGWRQALYLRKMVDMFERGDVAEALRHAIPLGGQDESIRQALGALRARSNLDITTPGGTTSAVGLDASLEQYLRDKYRKLFQRLEREGRIDEAAFVLAELLKSGVEAVDYLERNGRVKQAAQLAEKLALAPEIAVRLWILAGDATRAVRIARATGTFGDAIRLLKKKQDAQAGPLRALWAEYLAERGDLAEAADAIWPLEQYRSVALKWLLQAEHAGRAPGMRALVRKLALMPELLADSVGSIYALLDDRSDEGPAMRALLATELIALAPHSAATRRLAQEVLRHVIAERSAARNQLSKAEIKKLLALSDQGMLAGDLPTVSFGADPAKGTPIGARSEPLSAHAGERALLQIYDARCLPSGHYLLALGEGGVVRIDAKGKQLVHFPLPAYHLVLATNGERALALARRGDVVRASRIDLAACKVSDWISHPFDSWAEQYDGVVWNAVIDNRIVAIDTSQEHLAVIWQVSDLPGKVIDFQDDGTVQLILMANDKELELWRYALPSRRMVRREAIAFPAQDVMRVLVHPNEMVPVTLRFIEDGAGSTLIVRRAGFSEIAVALGNVVGVPNAQIQDGWLHVQTQLADGRWCCHVVDGNLSKVVATLYVAQPDQAWVRAQRHHILVFDRAGRLMDVDCTSGAIKILSLS